MVSSGFVGGTLIHTKNGLVPIEKIKIGDWVLSKPENGIGETQYKRVVKTFEYGNKPIWLVQAFMYKKDEKGVPYDADYQFIGCTANHLFWVKEKGWTHAEEVRMSSVLQLENGREAYVLCSLAMLRTKEGNDVAWGERIHGGAVGDGSGNNVYFDGSDIVVGDLGPVASWNFDGTCDDSSMWDVTTVFRRKVFNLEVEGSTIYFVGRMGIRIMY
jgi:hypothetical protein